MGAIRLLRTMAAISILCVPSLGVTGPPVDLSTPERTIATYYRGYSTGSKTMVMSTLLGDVSDLGLGIQRRYAIVAKKVILESTSGPKPGDIEIITHETSRWPDKEYLSIQTFYLRQFGNDWKIVDLFAEPLPPNVIYLGP